MSLLEEYCMTAFQDQNSTSKIKMSPPVPLVVPTWEADTCQGCTS